MMLTIGGIVLKTLIFGLLLDNCYCNVCTPDRCLTHGQCYPSGDDDYRCDCYRGWTGRNCQDNINNCHRDACQNRGQCIDQADDRYVCKCTEEYIGNNCEFINPCLVNTCLNGGVCKPFPDGNFICQCSRHFHGDFCQMRIRSCPRELQRSRNMCSRHGRCKNRVDGGLECQCDRGYSGRYCNKRATTRVRSGCKADYCMNGGRCERIGRGKEICYCAKNYSGSRCEIFTIRLDQRPKSINSTIPSPTKSKVLNSTVSYPKQRWRPSNCPSTCLSVRGNGICEQKCNSEPCQYDGGDCDPWKRCKGPRVAHCRDVFQNNICNPECNSVECLFDGQDCDRSGCEHGRQCAINYQNGVCNSDCNNPQCGFDGGDCHAKQSQTLLVTLDNLRKCSVNKREFELNLVLLTTIDEFRIRQAIFLQKLSSILKMVLTISKVTEITFHYSSAVSVTLNINPSECIEYGGKCFSSLEQISDFIKAGIQKSEYFHLPFRVVKVDSKTVHSRKSKISQINIHFLLLITIGAALAISFIVIGVLLREKWRKLKKKVRTAGIWSPSDGYSTSTLSINSNHKLKWPLESTANSCDNNQYKGNPLKNLQLNGVSDVTSRKRQYDNANLDTTALTFESISESIQNQNGVTPIEQTLSKLQTILNETAQSNSEESCAELGDYCNDFGESLLHIAARMNSDSNVIKRLHYASPAMLRTTDQWGRTPLATAVASTSSESIKQLVCFEKLYRKESKQNKCRSIQTCASELTVAKTTGLIEAVKLNCDDIINLLLDEGTPINVIDCNGRSVVHWAALYNNVALLGRLSAIKIFPKLVDFRDFEDKSPMFLAASEGNVQAVKFIVDCISKYGIKIDPISPCPSSVAKEHGFSEIEKLIHQVHVPLLPLRRQDNEKMCKLNIFDEHISESSKSNNKSLNDHESFGSNKFTVDYIDNSSNVNLLECFATEKRSVNGHCNSYLSNSSSSEMSPPFIVSNIHNITNPYKRVFGYTNSQKSNKLYNRSTADVKSEIKNEKTSNCYNQNLEINCKYPLVLHKLSSINCPF